MIGYYNYTVILTYIGTISGFTGMICTFNGDIRSALLCLMASGFCDMFDGKIAQTMQRTRDEKRFGIQIDSLSDLICFGVLPALIICKYTCGNIVCNVICAFYMLCALIRLAWFNVNEENRQNEEAGSRESYLGLPVTTAAVLIPLIISIEEMMMLHKYNITLNFLAICAILFLTPFKIKKLGNIGKIIMLIIGLLCLALVLMGVKI